MNSHHCLSEAEMRRWLSDSATDAEDSSLADRINECPRCQLLAESLLVSDDAALDQTAITKLQIDRRRETDAARGRGPADYELLEKLGEGGMGVVSKACQRGLGRLVALKTLRPEFSGVRHLRQRFQREAEAVGRLQHPSIVQIFEVGERGGEAFFAMEFVEGGTLKDRLKDGPLPISEGVRLVAQAARAVHHAHQRRIIHLDLKPGNILLAPASGRDPMTPKVADFGLARHVSDDGVADLTAMGLGAGTPAYMAPEQAAGETEKISAASDLYALGAVLYEVLTGRPPFVGKSQGEVFDQIRNADPTPPSRLRPTVSVDLDTICLKCLAKEPAARYASALELAEDLERTLRHEPIRARATPAWERLSKWIRRRPALAAAVAALAAVVLIVATVAPVLAFVFNQQATENAQLAAKERTAREEGEKDLRFARETMERFQKALRDVDQDGELRNNPAVARFGRDLVSYTLDYNKGFLARRGSDPAFAAEAAAACFQVGLMSQFLGRTADAVAAYKEAADRYSRLPPAGGGDDRRRGQAGVLSNLSTLYAMTGDGELARDCLEQCLAILTAIEAEGENDPDLVRELAITQYKVGNFQRDFNEPDAAEKSFDAAHEVLTRLVHDHPESVRYRTDLSLNDIARSQMMRRRGNLDGAKKVIDEAVKRLVPAGERPQLDTLTAERLADVMHEMGEIYVAMRRFREAEAAHRDALAHREKLRDRNRGVIGYETGVAYSHTALGALRAGRGDLDGAMKHFSAAVDVRKRLAEADRLNLALAIDLAGAHTNLGEILRATDDSDAAMEQFTAAERLLDPVVRSTKGRCQSLARQTLANMLFNRALTSEGLGSEHYQAALQDLNRAVELSPGAGLPPLNLWKMRLLRAVIHGRLKRYAEAEAEARTLDEAIVAGIPSLVVEMARPFALCADPRSDASPEDCRRRAVALLDTARRAGFFAPKERREALAEDPDFAALARDEQFLQLVRGPD